MHHKSFLHCQICEEEKKGTKMICNKCGAECSCEKKNAPIVVQTLIGVVKPSRQPVGEIQATFTGFCKTCTSYHGTFNTSELAVAALRVHFKNTHKITEFE